MSSFLDSSAKHQLEGQYEIGPLVGAYQIVGKGLPEFLTYISRVLHRFVQQIHT